MPLDFTYCPRCGAKLEVKTEHETEVPVCTNEKCGFIFWQNAKPATAAIIPNDKGQVLLTVRDINPGKGLLDWPGGFLDEAEDPRKGMIREIKEELNVIAEPIHCLGAGIDAYGSNDYFVMSVGYVCKITMGKPEAADEVAEVAWLHPKDIDRTKLAFDTTSYFLNEWVKYDNQ